MNLKDFDKKLSLHDWFYDYSDDGRVWRAGLQAREEIEIIAKKSPEHQELYRTWIKYMFSGPSFNTDKFTKTQLDEVRSSLGIL